MIPLLLLYLEKYFIEAAIDISGQEMSGRAIIIYKDFFPY